MEADVADLKREGVAVGPEYIIIWVVGIILLLFLMMGFFALIHLVRTNRIIARQDQLKKSILQGSAAMLVVVDGQGEIQEFNQSAEALSGLKSDSLIGTSAEKLTLLPHQWVSNPDMPLSQPRITVEKEFASGEDQPTRYIQWEISEISTPYDQTRFRIFAGIEITALKRAMHQNREMAEALSLTEDRERRQIAEEIHNGIGHQITFAINRLSKVLSEPLPQKFTTMLGEIQKNLQQMLDNMRALIFEISPTILYDLGLQDAIESLAEYYDQRHTAAFSFECNNLEKEIDLDLRLVLYKSVCELLNNIVKYADANRVDIRVNLDDSQIHIVVCDDGKGFDPALAGPRKGKTGGFGLVNMKNRLEYYHGQLMIDSQPNGGTVITMQAPLI